MIREEGNRKQAEMGDEGNMSSPRSSAGVKRSVRVDVEAVPAHQQR